MDAAIQVLSQKGYHNARMEEIAVAAGIGKGTIYEYFPSKMQLLQSIVERSYLLYDHAVVARPGGEQSFADWLRLLVEGHFRFCQQNTNLARMMFMDQEVIDQELCEWGFQRRLEKEARLQAVIESGIAKGELRPLNPKLMTLMISGIFAAIWVPLVLEGWDMDPAQAAGEIVDMLLAGMGTPT